MRGEAAYGGPAELAGETDASVAKDRQSGVPEDARFRGWMPTADSWSGSRPPLAIQAIRSSRIGQRDSLLSRRRSVSRQRCV